MSKEMGIVVRLWDQSIEASVAPFGHAGLSISCVILGE